MDRRDFIKRSGWAVVGLAASGTLLSCVGGRGEKAAWSGGKPRRVAPLKDANHFLGDLHNHCNVTYGHGDLKDALDAAREQLDFVAVTPHAMWPDIPGRDDARLAWVIDYHTGAFERLRQGGWEKYVAMMQQYNDPGQMLTFLAYECHSMAHGDHVALMYDLDAPLVECGSIPDLKERLKGRKAFVTPHHMGYQTGYRGYNWAEFRQGDQTPFVEMFSRHGLAESDMGDYNYLHDMGPRIYDGTVQYGLEKGYKFGLMGSTDQHAGYPGSYGDGRIVLLAPSLERDELWGAMQNRRMYCVTGDKIDIDFRINGALMGDTVKGNKREIYLYVEGQNYIDYVDILKNDRCIARLNAPYETQIPDGQTMRAKLKVNLGWNREEEYVKWLGSLSITEGEINDHQTCFRGAAFTSPQPGEHEFKTRVNKVLGKSSSKVDLELYSSKNPNVLTPAMQGMILDVTMPKSGKLVADFNGQQFSYTLDELLHGSKAHFMRGWLSEAIQFERAAPVSAFSVEHTFTDDQPQRDTDYYRVRVRQRDGQWAWSTPIWVERV